MNRIRFARMALAECPQYWWGDWLDVRFYLRELLSKLRGKTVADIGCGACLVTNALDSTNNVTGVDTDSKALSIARKKMPKAKLLNCTSQELPNGKFDAVIIANVIEVVEDKKELAREASRLLKPRGTLFLTTPNRAHLCYKNKKKISKKELEKTLEPFFEIELKGWNPFPPFPLWLPARLLARLPGYYELLKWLCERGWFKESGKTFIVSGVKKRI